MFDGAGSRWADLRVSGQHHDQLRGGAMRGRFDDLVADVATIRRALKLQEDHKTLGGNVTLADDDGVIWAADAGGSSRNVTLPARALANDGVVRLLVNLSTAGENFVVKNSAASTILTLPSGGVALVIATGTAEDPATRAWIAVPIGGEDLALADDLAITGDLTVTGNTALNGNNDIGNAAADTLGFYGATKVSQRASSVQATSNIASSSDFGATQLALVQEIMNTLTGLGLWKGTA